MNDNLIYDKPRSQGVANVIKRAHQLLDLKWSPIYALERKGAFFKPSRTGINHTGQEYFVGGPYSSARMLDHFIGLDISIDTYLSALHNPASVMYTRDLSDFDEAAFNPVIRNTFMFYGTVCSAFINYALGLPMHRSTHEMCIAPEFTKNEDQTAQGLELGDALVRTLPDGRTFDHLKIVTGIGRDSSGKVQAVEISESVVPITKSRWYTAEEYMKSVEAPEKYRSYRYRFIDSVEYSPYRGELGNIYNDELMLNYGEFSNYRAGEPVEFNVLCDADELVIESVTEPSRGAVILDLSNLKRTAVLGREYKLCSVSSLEPDRYIAYCTKHGVKSKPVSFIVVETPKVRLTDSDGKEFERVPLVPVAPDGSALTAESVCFYKEDGSLNDTFVTIALRDGDRLIPTRGAVRSIDGKLVFRTAALLTDEKGDYVRSFTVGEDVTLYALAAKENTVVHAEFTGEKCCTPSYLSWQEEAMISYIQRLVSPEELDNRQLETVLIRHNNDFSHFKLYCKNEYGRISTLPITFILR